MKLQVDGQEYWVNFTHTDLRQKPCPRCEEEGDHASAEVCVEALKTRINGTARLHDFETLCTIYKGPRADKQPLEELERVAGGVGMCSKLDQFSRVKGCKTALRDALLMNFTDATFRAHFWAEYLRVCPRALGGPTLGTLERQRAGLIQRYKQFGINVTDPRTGQPVDFGALTVV